MNYTILIFVIIDIILIHCIAHCISRKRKIGYGKSVFWSVLFSPFMGLLITLGSSRKTDA